MTAVILIVVLGTIGIVGIIGLFYMQAPRRVMKETATEIDRGAVVFQEGEFPRFPPHKRGEELSREQFAALMIDDHATDLARKALQESANDAHVSWLLYTEDLTDRNGILEGHFTLPYEVRSGHSMHGSSINIRCEFANDGRDSLLKVRRGDWIVVQGKLSFDGQNSTIRDARVVDDSTAPLAESP